MFDPHFDRFNRDDDSNLDLDNIEGTSVSPTLLKVLTFVVNNIKFVLVLFAVIIGALSLIIGKTFNITSKYGAASEGVANTLSSEVSQSDSLINTQELSDDHTIYLDLSGAIIHPGLYELRLGSRLSDLIALGGGFTSEASENWVNKNLNLASLLHDEQKIYIPFERDIEYKDGIAYLSFAAEDNDLLSSLVGNDGSTEVLNTEVLNNVETSPKNVTSTSTIVTGTDNGDNSNSSSDSNSNTGTQINVNTASSEDLRTLEGIGEAYASRIIANRPYSDLEELKSKSNVPISTITKNEQKLIF